MFSLYPLIHFGEAGKGEKRKTGTISSAPVLSGLRTHPV